MKLIARPFFILSFFIIFFPPAAMSLFSHRIDMVITVLRTLYCLLFLILYLLNKKISLIIIVLAIYSFSILIPMLLTIENEFAYETVLNHVYLAASSIAIFMAVELYFKNAAGAFIRLFASYYSLLVSVNLLLMIIFPDGVAKAEFNNMWITANRQIAFLGGKNSAIYIYILYALLLSHSYVRTGKLVNSAFLTIVTFQVLFYKSSTCILVWFMLLFFWIVRKKLVNIKILNYWFVLFSNILINVLVVIFNVSTLFDSFFRYAFDKTGDMSTRTISWKFAIELIKDKPITGWGNGAHSIMALTDVALAYHAHNQLLEVLLRGGVAALASWLALLIIIGKRIAKIKDKASIRLLCIITFSLFIALITESGTFNLHLMATLAIMANVYRTQELVIL